jgi:predicted nuclease with TOPRIM domain
MTQEESNDIKRHFEVVVENLRSDFRLVADDVAMNSERLDRLECKFDTLGSKFDRLEGTVDTLGSKFDRLEGEFNDFRDETRHGFAELFHFRDETRHNFAEIRSTLKPSNAELSRRVTTLERRYGTRKA